MQSALGPCALARERIALADERTLRTLAAARAVDCDWAVLTSTDAVAYAVQHFPPIETGPSSFDGGPCAAVVGPGGAVGLLVTETEHVAATSGMVAVARYESLGFSDQRPLEVKYEEAARRLLDTLGVRGRVAVEVRSLPSSLGELLRGRGASLVAIDEPLRQRRAQKTEEEIRMLRRCADVTGVGQAAARRAIAAGRTELEVFSDVRQAMEAEVGGRLAVAADLVSGRERTAAVGGWPTGRALGYGDPVLCDLAPRVAGYWGDSCTTHVVGRASAELLRFHDVACRALERARDVIRAGRTAGEVDGEVRGVIEAAGLRDPLHIGHGIGTSVHEHPRIVPGSSAVLQAGMVLMIEPGAYRDDVGGVRVEHMFLVTDAGCEDLSPFSVEFGP